MKSSIFVVEGQTEQIFLTNFIEQLAVLKKYTIHLTKFHNREIVKLGKRGHLEEDSTHIIQIINVENDDKVLSYIEDNLEKFFDKGFSAVFGLRDRYTGDKNKTPVSPAKVYELTRCYEAQYGMKVEITIAIEEVEAWFLAVPIFFKEYDSSLTTEKINEICGLDLDKTNVESIEHPSTMIHAILKTVGLEYKKKLNDSYKIASKLDYETLYLEKADSIAALKKTVNHLEIALS